MGRDSATSLAPGFRFHPTDEELVSYYLKRKVSAKPVRFDAISVIDIYKSEPWDLPGKSKLKTRDLEWYFFSALDKKYGNSSRTNRATEKGYWKTTGKDRPVRHGSRLVGMKKTLVYHIGRAPRGARTNWVMHEYKLTDEEMEKVAIVQDAFVLCRIFQKSGTGPKNGEQYGAPFIEDEWEENEELGMVPGNELVADGIIAGGGVLVDGEDSSANVDEGILSESAPPPPFDFYYGETSNSVEQSENFIEDDQKPAVGICETSEIPDGHNFFALPHEYGLQDRLVKHEYLAESSYDAVADAADEFDVGYVDGRYVSNEPFFSTSDNPSFSDELLLESNELSNVTESDPAAFDVLEEYLTFFDADGDNADMSFDPSEVLLGTESCVPDQAVLPEVAGCATEHPSPSKHTADLRYDNEASSSSSMQRSEDPKAESDLKYPFLKHTSHMLGSIPAPFASQFTSKDAAIQASSSVRVTAGMIVISNTTPNVNNLYGKDSDLNLMYLYGIVEGLGDINDIHSSELAHSSKSGSLMSRYFLYLFVLLWVVLLSSLKSLEMASGSNMDMASIPNGGYQLPPENFEDDLRTELELFLRENSNHSETGRDGDLNIYRSGSAPPTVEGSLNAVGRLFTSSDFRQFSANSNSNDRMLSEDEIRSHPDYLSYYYSNAHINPRLPPPLMSKEDWRAARRFQGSGSLLGGQGDWNWKKLVDGNTSSSLFSMQPGSSVQQAEKNNRNVMEFGSANRKNISTNALSEWQDRGRDGLVGSHGNGIGTRRKSFADIVQEGLDESASLSGQLSRPASQNSFRDVDTRRMTDIKPPGLCNGVGPIEDFHNSTPPGFVGVQNHNKAVSHSFQYPNCSTLSRSTTPEPQLVGRSSSSGLPPVGSRVFPVEKNITVSNVQNGHSAGFTELPDISGLHLSSIRPEDGVNGVQPRLQCDLGEQSNFMINTSNGIHTHTLPEFSDKKFSQPSDSINLARKNGTIMNPRAPTMSSPDHGNFPKRTSSSTNLYLKANSPGFVSKEWPTRHLQNASLQSVDLAQNMNQSSTINSYGTSNHIKLPSGTSDRTIHAGSSLQPHNYYGITHGDLQGLRSAYLEALLAQQKQHYELSLSGNPSVYNHGLFANTPYGSGIPYLANQVLDSGLSSTGHGGTMLHNEQMMHNERMLRFNSMMRSSIGAHGSLQPDIGNNVDRSLPSTLLDEFKSNKTRSFELSDIVDNVIEFSMDQYGSRFIQQKLETANVEEKTKIFPEIIPHARTLMTDVFGNYVIQKFFEHGTKSQRKELADQVSGHVLPLSLQMYGCRVIQKALEVVDLDQQTQMVAELDGSVMKCVRDQNGNHVIQKCIECVPQDRIQFIISAFYGQVLALSTHPYGCRVIQRVLEHCNDLNTQQIIMDEVMQSVCLLAQDQYGNYVIQHVLEFGKPHERSAIISKLAGQIVKMSQQKFASNVVEKCLTFGGSEERQLLINEILGSTDENEPLQAMMKDPFGNYVVQKVLESCDDRSLELILSRIRVHLTSLKRYTYGKHIVSRVEKLIATGERRIGQSSSSFSSSS